MFHLSPTTRQLSLIFAILALPGLGSPAAARILEPGETLDGFPASSFDSVAISSDGLDLYAAGNSHRGPTPGLVWLRRDPADGRLQLRRNYFSGAGEQRIHGAVLSEDESHLVVLRENSLETFRRGAGGELAFAHAVELSDYHLPQVLRRLPHGDLLVIAESGNGIYRLDANGKPVFVQRLDGARLDFETANLDDGSFVSGEIVAKRQDGLWTWLPLGYVTGFSGNIGPNTVASPDGRFLHRIERAGLPPDGGYFFLQTLEKIGDRLVETGRSPAPAGGDLLITAAAIHPENGHLYLASVNYDGTGDGTIHHYAPLAGGRRFELVASHLDPSDDFYRRSAKDSLAFSPDGRHLYATFAGEPVALFGVGAATGELTHLPRGAGSASHLERPFKLVPGPGGELYALTPHAVLQTRWDGGTPRIVSSLDLGEWAAAAEKEIVDLVLTPGGGAGVLASPRDLVFVERNRETGELGLRPETSIRLELGEVYGLGISPDGRHVYVLRGSGGTDVYFLRRDQPKLVHVQFFYRSGARIRLSPNGTDVLFHWDGYAPVMARRSPETGRLEPATFPYSGPRLAEISDAEFTDGGRALYLFRTPASGANQVAEKLIREADGSWSTAATAQLGAAPVGPPVIDAAGSSLWQLHREGLGQHGLVNSSSSYRLEELEALSPPELGSAGGLWAAGEILQPRSPRVLSLLPDETALVLANPASGNLRLFRRGCSEQLEAGPCFAGQRFRAEVSWRDSGGRAWPAEALPFGSDQAQVFSFFSNDNWEMMVKVLDGCAINGRFWLYAAASTDVAFEIRLTDTWTGSTRLYTSPAGPPAPAITDSDAFATCGAASPGWSPQPPDRPELTERPALLLSSSFEVEVAWTDHQGHTGAATGLQEEGDVRSGLFYFFTPDNWEMQVKVLNGCAINGHHWVLGAATTDVGYTVAVRHPTTGRTKTYTNPVGRASPAIIDIQAFSCS